MKTPNVFDKSNDSDVPTTAQRVTTTAMILIGLGVLLAFAARGVWCWLRH